MPEFDVAANADSLADGKLAGATIDVDGQVYALVDAESVECPWDASYFDMRDGSVRPGPATAPAPVFESRIRNAQVEVRHA